MNKLNNKSYKVVVTETSSRIITLNEDEIRQILDIEDNSYETGKGDARAAVSRLWHNEEIVLDADDFDEVDFTVLDTSE